MRGRSATTGWAVRPAPALLLACLGLGACGASQGMSPGAVWRDLTGETDASRAQPPGLDDPFPNLARVPPRPERPPPEVRDAITAALAADRRRSREPLTLRAAPGGAGGSAPGMAAGPPPRPALAAAPPVPWMEAPRAPAARRGDSPPAAATAPSPATRPAAPPAPEVPDAAPAAPPAELLGAPPPPSSDLLAPPPPARR